MTSLTPKPSEKKIEIFAVSFSTLYEAKKKKTSEKIFLRKWGVDDWTKEDEKKAFKLLSLWQLRRIWPHQQESTQMNWKSSKKTMRTEIKENSSPDLNPLDYSQWSVLENKTNATSHSNIGSLKTATDNEWNRMSEEFIFKAC